jgi:DNA-damage-inducible protein D
VNDKGFALIRSKGDKALFRLDTAQLKRKFSIPENRPVADFLPTVSIKAKDFAAAMTAENVQIKNLTGVPSIEKEHVDNNLDVRKIMIERGLVPEELPPAEDIKKVERRLNTEKEKALKQKGKP